jgi:hypothetical protein
LFIKFIGSLENRTPPPDLLFTRYEFWEPGIILIINNSSTVEKYADSRTIVQIKSAETVEESAILKRSEKCKCCHLAKDINFRAFPGVVCPDFEIHGI